MIPQASHEVVIEFAAILLGVVLCDSLLFDEHVHAVFTARCTLVQSAVLRSHVVCLSVRLSVCLSVTLVNCDHIGWNSSKMIS